MFIFIQIIYCVHLLCWFIAFIHVSMKIFLIIITNWWNEYNVCHCTILAFSVFINCVNAYYTFIVFAIVLTPCVRSREYVVENIKKILGNLKIKIRHSFCLDLAFVVNIYMTNHCVYSLCIVLCVCILIWAGKCEDLFSK